MLQSLVKQHPLKVLGVGALTWRRIFLNLLAVKMEVKAPGLETFLHEMIPLARAMGGSVRAER